MTLPTGLYRADHVGSFLRPALHSEPRDVQDKHIAGVVKNELAAGLRSITDGETRRAYFHLDFLKHLEGVEVKGSIKSASTKDSWSPPTLAVTEKLGHPKPIQVEDFKFLQSQIKANGAEGKATIKVAIPSPTMLHFRGGRSAISSTAYPSLEPAFFDDLARVYREEIADLYAAGCRFIQLDDTNLAYLCDSQMRLEARSRGEDVDALPRRYVDLINAAISQRPRDLTVGIHLCRGNYQSQWFASGGYEPVAEVLFKELEVDAFFLEYDDARSGDFAPLRHLPDGKYVVLGLMSSKKAELDDKEEIVKRLREAAAFSSRGLDAFCLSHQCGFSSTYQGNSLTEEQQWAKVRLEVEIAKEVWGEDLSR